MQAIQRERRREVERAAEHKSTQMGEGEMRGERRDRKVFRNWNADGKERE